MNTVQEKETIKNSNKEQKIPFWKTIFSYLDKYKKNALVAVLFSAITGIGVALQPLVIKYIVDEGIVARKSISYVLIACGIYLLLALSRMLSYRFALYHLLKSIEGTLFNMRRRFFSHVNHMCMRFFDHRSSGELYNCIMGSPMGNIQNYLRNMIISVPHQAISFVISVAALAYYDWMLTLVMFATASLMVVINFFSKKVIKKSSKVFIGAETETSKYISDILHGMDSVKMYSIEDDAEAKFSKRLSEMRDKSIAFTFLSNKENLKPEFTQYFGTAVVYAVGAYACIKRGLTVGVLYAFLSSMGIILSTLTSWLSIGLQKSAAKASLEKIEDIIRETTSTPELADGEVRNLQKEKEKAIRANIPVIEFDKVSFAYTEKKIFEKLSCAINYNESVALVGGSGSGKSTFTKLLMRLYEIDSGEIRVHGQNIKNYHIHDLRYSVGIVPQSPFIFQGTIWDNVRITCPEASNVEIIKAMEIAHVHEFVNELPLGWTTRIGDGALSLSGGQKQRIAIARAVLKNPDILIFDEATSALDNVSERHIQQAMEDLMKSHTVIIVAHRLSTIRNVDRILVFDHGDIVEEGKYDELAAKEGGAFRALLDCVENS